MFRSALYGEDPVSNLSLRAMGSTLCVMGGRLWFLGHACSSYTCTGSALDIVDYGLARARDSAIH